MPMSALHNATAARQSAALLQVLQLEEEESIDVTIERITIIAEHFLRCHRCVLFFVSGSRQDLYTLYSPSAPRDAESYIPDPDDPDAPLPAYMKPVVFDLDSGVVGEVARTGKMVVIPDVQSLQGENRAWDTNLDGRLGLDVPARSLVCFPIATKAGSVYAVLLAINKIGEEQVQVYGEDDGDDQVSKVADLASFGEDDIMIGTGICVAVGATLRGRMTDIVMLRTKRSLLSDRIQHVESMLEMYGQKDGSNRAAQSYPHGLYPDTRTLERNKRRSLGTAAFTAQFLSSIHQPLPSETSALPLPFADIGTALAEHPRATLSRTMSMPSKNHMSLPPRSAIALTLNAAGEMSSGRESPRLANLPPRSPRASSRARAVHPSNSSSERSSSRSHGSQWRYEQGSTSPSAASSPSGGVMVCRPSTPSSRFMMQRPFSTPASQLPPPAWSTYECPLATAPYSSFANDNSASAFAENFRNIVAPSPFSCDTNITWELFHSPSVKLPAIADLASLNFSPFDWDDDALLHACGLMLQDVGAIAEFELDLSVLQSFLVGVRSKYRDNAYHNFKHGFAVMQFAFYVIKCTGIIDSDDFPCKLDLFALLIACLCHDVDHTGHTNAFEVASGSELALRHNDQAVLENHHASTTFALLREPSMAIFSPDHSKITGDQARAMRKIIISCILATDMARHFEMCHELDFQEAECGSIDWQDPSHRQFIWNLITHASDLSGQILPLPIAQKWEERVTSEFISQSKHEQDLGLPLTKHIQDLDVDSVRWRQHLSYIDVVMTPLWTAFCEMFPPLRPCCENLITNRKHWSKLAFSDRPEDCDKPVPGKHDVSHFNHQYHHSICFDADAVVHLHDDSPEHSLNDVHDDEKDFGEPVIELIAPSQQIHGKRWRHSASAEEKSADESSSSFQSSDMWSRPIAMLSDDEHTRPHSNSLSSQRSTSADSTAPASPALSSSGFDSHSVALSVPHSDYDIPHRKHESIRTRRESQWPDLVTNSSPPSSVHTLSPASQPTMPLPPSKLSLDTVGHRRTSINTKQV